GHHGQLQSQPDCGSRIGQLHHDHHRGLQHPDGNLSHHRHRQWRRCAAEHHRHPDRHRAADVHYFGLALLAQRGAGQSGNFHHHHHHQQWVQQRDYSVGFRHALGHYGQLQSQPDCGSRIGQLHHDHHRGSEHPDGNLSHHRHRQWRRCAAEHHRHPDRHRAADVHYFGLALLAQRGAGQSGNFHHHHHHQQWVQQRDYSVGFRHALGHYGQLQSQPDCGSRIGQLHHDHHRGSEHPDGNLSHHRHRQWRRCSAKHHRHPDRHRATHVHYFGLALLAQRGAGQSGNVHHHHHYQQWVQQRDYSLGFRYALGHYGQLQSQPDCGARLGQLHHDHHRGLQHPDGNLSHHRDRQWRRRPATHHGESDSDGAGGSVLDREYIAWGHWLQRLSFHDIGWALHQT